MPLHNKYYQIGGMTLKVSSELPILDHTFHPKFKIFEKNGPGDDTIVITHHFTWDEQLAADTSGERLHFSPPWAIYKRGDQIYYKWINPDDPHLARNRMAVANHTHTRIDIFTHPDWIPHFKKGDHTSLTLLPSDQILIGRLLAYRQGFIIHSLGAILDAGGYAFVGHSSAGKSTMAGIIKKRAEILCDDRNIIRNTPGGPRLFGTWSHGDVPDVSANSALLKSIFFLEQAKSNSIIKLTDKKLIFKRLIACLIRPLGTSDWWERSIDHLVSIAWQTPCWNLQFDKSGNVLKLIEDLNKNLRI